MFGFFEYLYYISGEGNGTPIQYSCLENPMVRGAWWATVHRVAKSQTRLSDFTYLLTLTYLHLLHFYTSWSIKDDLPSHPRQLKPWTKYMKQWISDVDQQAVQDSHPE